MAAHNWIDLSQDADTGIETLRAHFEGHAYDPHWHDSYLIGAASLQLINPKTWIMALAVASVFAGNGANTRARWCIFPWCFSWYRFHASASGRYWALDRAVFSRRLVQSHASTHVWRCCC